MWKLARSQNTMTLDPSAVRREHETLDKTTAATTESWQPNCQCRWPAAQSDHPLHAYIPEEYVQHGLGHWHYWLEVVWRYVSQRIKRDTITSLRAPVIKKNPDKTITMKLLHKTVDLKGTMDLYCRLMVLAIAQTETSTGNKPTLWVQTDTGVSICSRQTGQCYRVYR